MLRNQEHEQGFHMETVFPLARHDNRGQKQHQHPSPPMRWSASVIASRGLMDSDLNFLLTSYSLEAARLSFAADSNWVLFFTCSFSPSSCSSGLLAQ